MEESMAPEHFANHSLNILGYSNAFEELWRERNLHWVTCQSTAIDGIAKDVVVGLQAERDKESLILLTNPFTQVAQNALQGWEERQSVDILLHYLASGSNSILKVPSPSSCDDNIQLPIVLTYEDSQSHAVCVASLLNQSPECVRGMQTAYAMMTGLGLSELKATYLEGETGSATSMQLDSAFFL